MSSHLSFTYVAVADPVFSVQTLIPFGRVVVSEVYNNKIQIDQTDTRDQTAIERQPGWDTYGRDG